MNDFISIATKPSLLFLDDEPRILNAMRAVFKIGYNVTISTDGYEALELVKQQHFDVIVSDQRMPTMTGVEFLRQVAELSPTSVRILLTGYSDLDAIVGAINEVEVHRFMQKPWDNAVLKRIVGEAVQIAMALRENDVPEPPGGNGGDGGGHADAPNTLPAVFEDSTFLPGAGVMPPAADKERVVVVDQEKALYQLVQAEFSNNFDILYAPSIPACLALMEHQPCSVLICSLNVDNEADRLFLM